MRPRAGDAPSARPFFAAAAFFAGAAPRWKTSFVSVDSASTYAHSPARPVKPRSSSGRVTRCSAQYRVIAPRASFACTAGPGKLAVTTGARSAASLTDLAYSCDATLSTNGAAVASITLAGTAADAQSRSRVEVEQTGYGNRIEGRFYGWRNRARLAQRGDRNAIAAVQDGFRNRMEIGQRGRGHWQEVLQSGLANRVLTRQFGEDLSGSVYQSGNGNIVGVAQVGEGHSATTVQDGNGNILGVVQIGSGQNTTYHQIGDGNADIVVQFGWD